jgi:hypothetical protein|tara:strand:+ start:494 stop:667 length:174 start_codon:yes stop_codon:yes gene_type:complete
MKIDETVMLSINRVENSLIQKWRDYMTDGLISEAEFNQMKHIMLLTAKDIRIELVGK